MFLGSFASEFVLTHGLLLTCSFEGFIDFQESMDCVVENSLMGNCFLARIVSFWFTFCSLHVDCWEFTKVCLGTELQCSQWILNVILIN